MTLRLIDGFESYNNNISLLPNRYTVNTIATSAFEAGRIIGSCLAFNGVSMTTPTFGNQQTWVIGFAFQNVNMTQTTATQILELRDGTNVQVDLRFNPATQLLQVNRGATVLGTGSKLIKPGVWYYIELKVKVDSSTGTVDLKVNTIADITLSSQNTQQSGSAQANNVSWRGTNQQGRYRIDDVYILDGAGSTNNNFLGDMKVESLRPSAEGSNSGWDVVPTGTANFEAVQTFGDSRYIETNTVNDKDTYVFNNLLKIDSSIAGVQVCVWARNTDSVQHTIKSVTRRSNTDYDASAAQTVTDTGFNPLYFIMEQDPSTTATWTVSGVNEAEYGVKLMS